MSVRAIYEHEGWQLTSEAEYKDTKTPIPCVCPVCGKTCRISLNNFQSGTRCRHCRHDKIAALLRTSDAEIRRLVEGAGCTLLEIFRGKHNQPCVRYLCNCKRETVTGFREFKGRMTRCRECGRKRRAEKWRKTTDSFVAEAKAMYGKTAYCYDKVDYRSAIRKVIITCLKHGDFSQRPADHLSGYGCPTCGLERSVAARKLSNEYVQQVFEAAGCKWLDDEYITTKHPTNYIASCGHKEIIPLGNFLNGMGRLCKECAIKRQADKRRKSLEQFIKQANEHHGDCYDYSQFVYVNSHTKGTIFCKKHGGFLQTPNDHLQGRGCPTCRESQGERKIRLWLERNHKPHRQEYRYREAGIFDFVVRTPRGPAAIEFQGWQHYGPLNFGSTKPHAAMRSLYDCIRRDRKKAKWCQQKNLPLLAIPYWDYKRISEILDDFFAGREPRISEPPEIVKKYEPHRQKILERIEEKLN